MGRGEVRETEEQVAGPRLAVRDLASCRYSPTSASRGSSLRGVREAKP